MAGVVHLRNGWRVDVLLEDLRLLGGVESNLIVLVNIWRSFLATIHDGVDSDDEVSVIHCADMPTYAQLPNVQSVENSVYYVRVTGMPHRLEQLDRRCERLRCRARSETTSRPSAQRS